MQVHEAEEMCNHFKKVKIVGDEVFISDDTEIGHEPDYKPVPRVLHGKERTATKQFRQLCVEINKTHRVMKLVHESSESLKINQPKSYLHESVTEFLERILDTYMPLGIPSIQELISARSILKQIKYKMKNSPNRITDDSTNKFITKKSNEFYQMIPRIGRNLHRPRIDTIDQCNIKREIIKRLELILKTIETGVQRKKINPLDFLCNSFLDVELTPIPKDHSKYSTFISDFHILDGFQNKIKHLFSVKKKEWCNTVKSDTGNPHYLFHSTQLINMIDILREGLRIAPAHVHSFNNWFGRGIYFYGDAEAVFNYAQRLEHKIILVCRVALGKPQIHDNYNMFNTNRDLVYPLQRNKQSLKVNGKLMRSAFQWNETYKAYLPLGAKCITSAIDMLNIVAKSSYGHDDEFLVQHENQVIIKHIIEMK